MTNKEHHKAVEPLVLNGKVKQEGQDVFRTGTHLKNLDVFSQQPLQDFIVKHNIIPQ